MRPCKLRVQGLASFVDPVEVDFEGLELFAITGPTGAGKSSLLTAMTAALYGRAPEVADDLRQLISTASTEARILFEFDAGGRRYRAQRAIHRNRNVEVRLDVQEGEGWKGLIRGAREARSEVERILGLDYDAFTKVVMLPQGQVADFLRGQGRERRKILVELLGLDIYQRVQQTANAEASAAQGEVDTLERMLRQDYAEATPERLEEVRSAMAEASVQVETLSRQLTRVEAVLEAAHHEHARAETVTRAEAEARETRAAIAGAEAEVSTAQAAIETFAAQAGDLERQIALLGYDPARHVTLQRSEVEARQALAVRARSTTLEQEDGEGSQRQAALTEQLTRQHEALAEARARLAAEDSAAAQGRTQLERLEQQLGPRVEVVRLRERARQYAIDLRGLEAARAARQATETEIAGLAERVARAAAAEGAAQEARARAERDQVGRQSAVDAQHYVIQQAQRAGRDLAEAGKRHVQAQRAHTAAASEAGRHAKALEAAEGVWRKAKAVETAAAAALQAERSRHMAHALRQGLAPGDPCPVCERAVEVVPPSHAPDVETAETALERAKRACARGEERLNAAQQAAARADERTQGAHRDVERAGAAVAEATSLLLGGLPADLRGTDGWLAVLEQRLEGAVRELEAASAVGRKAQGALAEASGATSRLEAEHAVARQTLADRDRAIDELATRCTATAQVLDRAIARAQGRDLEALLGEIDGSLLEAERERDASAERLEMARATARETERACELTAAALDREGRDASRRQAERQRLAAEIADLEASLVLALGAADAITLAALPAQLSALEATKSRLDRLDEQRRQLEVQLGQVREHLAQARGNLQAARTRRAESDKAVAQARSAWRSARHALDEAAAAASLDALDVSVDRLNDHRTRAIADRDQALHSQSTLLTQERMVAERIERAATLRQELAQVRQRAAVARELGQLLGGPQLQDWLLTDAMRLLAEDASVHLERLSDGRYRLQVKDLDFDVTDRWNADAVRSVKTLSGGETFLTALAVALALADRVAGRAEATHGHHPLESLFIDEGFGSLDAGETLDNVAGALEQLQTTHRVIGVVTHLPQLADRLPAQIRVIKDMGRSRVEMATS